MSWQAIIFDCDGVLVDSEIVGLDASIAFLREHGFDWQPKDMISRFTGMRDDHFTRAMADAYAEVIGRTPSEDEARALVDGVIETRRSQRHTMTAVPGAEKSAAAATSLAGVETAVASSSRMVFLQDKLSRYGLWDVFAPHVYSAESVEHGKPAPDIFLYTAQKLGIAPDQCLVIEDAAHGIAAARAAGMDVWGFCGGGHCFDGHGERLAEAGASEILADHDALSARIAALG